ncbi:MAG: GTPase Era [Desulfomonilaceae bacterium]|nr:GTPase Era [Desulfomonilaceae bacterium]
MESVEHRSGFVAVVGRPNVGKSTLVNRIMGTELSIVTSKAQTTRHRISAIYTVPEAQMILLDTPGLHEAAGGLNRSLVATAMRSLEDADGVLIMVVPGEEIHEQDLRIVDLVKASKSPSVLAINKIDTIRHELLLPMMDAYAGLHTYEAIVPISALSGSGVDDLVRAILKMLPEGPPLFPEDDVSDLPVRFFVAEIIREQIITMTGQEIPYKTTVVVENFKRRSRNILIQADIHVEKESQKKIVVGKRGAMVKRIGTAARTKIEEFLESPVRLELFVKVTPNWTRNERLLREFGY